MAVLFRHSLIPAISILDTPDKLVHHAGHVPRGLVVARHEADGQSEGRELLDQHAPLAGIRLQHDLRHGRRAHRPRVLDARPVHLREVEVRPVLLKEDGDLARAVGAAGGGEAGEVIARVGLARLVVSAKGAM